MPIFKRTFSQDLDLLEQHITKDILSQTDCKTILTKLRTTFKNAFNSEFKERIQKYTRFNAQFFQDVDTFTSTMLLNVDQLQKQLDKDEFQEDGSMISLLGETYFVEYTRLEVQHFRDTLLQHLGNVKKSVAERTHHQRKYERRVNKRQMQTQESKIDTGKALDADLVDTESIRTDSTVQDDSSWSGNHIDADDTDIRPI
ncbi:hypothetical protein Tco_1187045 [Tanacetum coccineum]